MMIFNRFKEFIEIEKDIWLYKNFFTIDEQKYYKDLLENFSEEDWQKHGNYEDQDHDDIFWMDKLSIDIIEQTVSSRLINLVAPVHWTFQHTNFIRLRIDQDSELHHHKGEIQYEYECSSYIGDWVGGEIIFPNLNFSYKPEAGDLIIFKSDLEHEHYTSKVLDGTRYCYTDFLYRHPGYFVG